MKELVALFTAQLKEALQIGKNASLSASDKEFRNVVITGLGGSGIGGCGVLVTAPAFARAHRERECRALRVLAHSLERGFDITGAVGSILMMSTNPAVAADIDLALVGAAGSLSSSASEPPR